MPEAISAANTVYFQMRHITREKYSKEQRDGKWCCIKDSIYKVQGRIQSICPERDGVNSSNE